MAHKFVKVTPDTYVCQGKCVLSGREYTTAPFPASALYLYQSGLGLVQDIFHDLSADDREFIMSGISPEAWDETFSDEEE